MAWSPGGSKVFQRYLVNMIGNVVEHDWDANTIKIALYNDNITPDNDVATDVLTGYNGSGSEWVTANEVISSGEWDAGGVALASKTIDEATADVVFIDAADTASAAGATLTNAYGGLVYNDSLTNKPGMCYLYFGGANSVTNGTFTVVYHANGIIRYTL